MAWIKIGPGGGGWYRDVAVDPINSNVVYITGDLNGVHKSIDYGATWAPSNNGLLNVATNDIQVHPTSTNILLLATNGGVYKSINGGSLWTHKKDNVFVTPNRLAADNYKNAVAAMAINPISPNIVFTGGGTSHYFAAPGKRCEIYKSTNTGETWDISSTGLVYSVDANGKNTLCIRGFSFYSADVNIVNCTATNGFYRSTNGGSTWTRLVSGLTNTKCWKSVVDPNNGNIIYLTTEESLGVYKSTNAGASWSKITNGLAASLYEELMFDPNNSSRLLMGSRSSNNSLYHTTNGGSTWSLVGNNPVSGWLTGTTTTAFTIDKNNSNRIYSVNVWAAFRSSNGWVSGVNAITQNISGNRWKTTGSDILVTTSIYSHPTIPGKVFFTPLDTDLLVSDDYGDTFRSKYSETHAKMHGDPSLIVADPSNFDILYLVGGYDQPPCAMMKSVDVGESWTNVAYTGMTTDSIWKFLTILPTGTTTTRTMFASIYDNDVIGGIYKSTNSGQSWTQVKALRYSRMTAVDPNNSNKIFAAFGLGEGLWVSTNTGTSWTQIDPTNMKDVTYVLIDPNNSNIVWVAQRGYSYFAAAGIWKSTNGGTTFTRVLNWETLLPGQGVRGHTMQMIFHPGNSNIVYVAGLDAGAVAGIFVGQGVYRTTDGGVTWATFNEGLHYLMAMALEFDKTNPNILYLGTAGSGFAKYNFTTVANLPIVNVGSPSLITTNSMRLNASVNDNGITTFPFAQWDLTTAYTNSSATTPSTINAGSGSTAVLVNVSGLSPNTLYHYRFYAINTAGQTNSPDFTFTTLKTLVAPTNLVVTPNVANLNLTWSDSNTDETGFKVYRSNDGTSGWAVIVTPTVTNYSDNVGLGVTRYYRISAYRTSDNTESSFSSVIGGTTTNVLVAPTNLQITVSRLLLQLSWSDTNTDETNFRVERSSNGTSGWTEIGTPTVTNYSDNVGTYNTTRYYRVRVYRSSDSTFSSYSNIVNATTVNALVAPTNLMVSPYGMNLQLSWSDSNTDETGFKIYRSDNGTTGWTLINSTVALNYVDSIGLPDITRYYRVTAYRNIDLSESTTSNVAFGLTTVGIIYYIDPSTGNDADDGLTTGTAWASLDNIHNNSTYDIGTQFLFKCGETFGSGCIIACSGSIGNPIVFGSYDTGAKPVFDGNDTAQYIFNVLADKQYLKFENLELKDCNPAHISVPAGLLITERRNSNITIKDCKFSQNIKQADVLYGMIVGRELYNSRIETSEFTGGGIGVNLVPNIGISGADVHHIIITDCNFHDIDTRTGGSNGIYGIAIRSKQPNSAVPLSVSIGAEGITENIDITNNVFDDISYRAIECLNSVIGFADLYNINIVGNSFDHIEEDAIYLGRVSDRNGIHKWSNIDDNTFTKIGYTIEDTITVLYDSNAIELEGSINVVIENNDINAVGGNSDGCNAMIFKDGGRSCSEILIRSNFIMDCADSTSASAIYVTAGNTFEIYNNIIADCSTGVFLPAASNNDIKMYNNTIDFCRRGVYASNASQLNNEVVNNILSNIETDVSIIDSGIGIYSDSTGLSGNYNVHYLNGDSNYGGVYAGGAEDEEGDPDYSTSPGIAVDDFELGNVSIALNIGTSVTLSFPDGTEFPRGLDFKGNVVPYGVGPDMGAIERQTAVTVTVPVITNLVSSDITRTTALFAGGVDPNSDETDVTFEWGDTTSYGSSIVAEESPVNGGSSVPVTKAITGLTEDTLYHWRIVAVNSAGTVNSTDQTFTTLATLSAPTDVIVTQNGLTLEVSWTDSNTNEDRFLLERSDDGTSGWMLIATPTDELYNDVLGTYNTSRFYRVRAQRDSDVTISEYSDTTGGTTIQVFSAPTDLIVTQNVTDLDLTWNDANTDETGFKIERSDDGITGWAQIATTTDMEYSDVNLSVGIIKYYRVRAYRDIDSANSPYSDIASGIIVDGDTSVVNITSFPISSIPITNVTLDINNQDIGSTPFSRVYNNEELVQMTAPATFGDYIFIKWEVNGQDIESKVASLTVSSNAEVRAIYIFDWTKRPGCFGAWFTKGGFGGTAQNPVVEVDKYGLKVRYAGEYQTELISNSIQIGNIVIGEAPLSAIRLTNTGVPNDSGLFGYSSEAGESFALRLDGTASIAGFDFDHLRIYKYLGTGGAAIEMKVTGVGDTDYGGFFVSRDNGELPMISGILTQGSSSKGDIVFFAGSAGGVYTASDAVETMPFYVTGEGFVRMTTGRIGGLTNYWDIDADGLSANSINARIVGGLIQTAENGKRIELDASTNKLRFINEGGGITGTIYSGDPIGQNEILQVDTNYLIISGTVSMIGALLIDANGGADDSYFAGPLAVSAPGAQGYEFFVGGDSYFEGTTNISGTLSFASDSVLKLNQEIINYSDFTYSWGWGRFGNLAYFNRDSVTVAGAIVIQTNIPSTSYDMFKVRIEGHKYDDNGIVDIQISAFVHTDGSQFLTVGYTNVGSRYISRIRLARNTSTGMVAIILGETSTDFVYLRLIVTDLMHTAANQSYASGWIISQMTSLSGYSWLVDVPDRTNLGGIVTATSAAMFVAGNAAIGTTDLDGSPPIGRLTIKGTTNDGSTNIIVGRDSNESNVFTIGSNGDLLLSGSVAIDGADNTIGPLAINYPGPAGYSLYVDGNTHIDGNLSFTGEMNLAENAGLVLDSALSADGKYSGIIIDDIAGATLAFGDLCYLDPTDSRWELADANAAVGADGDPRGILGICVLAAAGNGSATKILLYGMVRADAVFPALTIGEQIYVSETAGDVVIAKPTTADAVIRVVAIGFTADVLFFNPSLDYITHV